VPSHNTLIQQALARGVRAGTALQDAMVKVRRARKANEYEFELALGELWILASDVFKQRNGFQNQLKKQAEIIKGMEEELEYWREKRREGE